jgi:GT2 family glycosyltransferase/glycosyltransferase involved in cell wall biosynthesis
VQPHLAEVGAWQAEARDWRLQYVICHSFVQSLSRSAAWKLLRPLRAARELLWPRGFGAQDLMPWNQLEPDREAPPGTWVATGPSPYFIVPCVLPAGWLRFRLRMTTEVAGRLELSDIGGNGIADFDCLKQIDVHGQVERDDYVYLRRAVLGLRLNPLNTPGRFRVHDIQVTPVPPLAAAVQALHNKLAALRRYGLVKRALANGIGLLLRGRLIEFIRKLYDGLHWTQEARQADKETRRQGDESEQDGMLENRYSRVSSLSSEKRKLDIVYVLKGAGLCGGVRVVVEHATRLRARGHNVSLYYLTGEVDSFKQRIPAIRFHSPGALKAALAHSRGIKVATWYETAFWVADCLQPGDRGYYLVQDIEDCYGSTPQEREAAQATYRLDLRLITEGVWVRDQLKQRFGRNSVFVGMGLDLDTFQPVLASRDSQRILAQARTWSAGGAAGARLKGWETARDTVGRCCRLNPRTTLTTFSMEGRPQCASLLPHSHFQWPSDATLAQLYSQAGLYLLTSTHEGFGLTAAEAMACGCPVVATYAQGNEEFCLDGQTALLAPAGDVEQLARHCLTLQSDPAFAAELGQNGRRLIRNYTWDGVIDRLEREFLHPSRSAPKKGTVPLSSRGLSPFSEPTPNGACQHSDLTTPRSLHTTGEYPDLQLSEKPTHDCTVVIPTINDAQLVVQCVSSCRRHLAADAEVEFLVVDDGTHDPAIQEELQRAAHDLGFRLLKNHQNLGFSATVNHGMRHARGRFILLCNNDIVFFQPWLEAIKKAFDADPNLGILGARLLYPNGTVQHAGVDKVAGQLRWHHTFGGWPGDHHRVKPSRYVWSVTGALFAIRREVLRQLGGFSTAYATAYEDLDYCLHAWSHGIQVGYCAELAAYHQEGRTRGATPGQKQARPLVWSERERAGGIYFEKKWAALREMESIEAFLRRPPHGTTNNSTGPDTPARTRAVLAGVSGSSL